MDPITLALTMVATMSELLPVPGFTKANETLNAAQQFIVHIHAASECHVEIDARSPAQSPPPAAPGAYVGPAAIARFAESPP
jgi:hypothetical protein